eukprot:TRINITY_DN4657_c0_g1_i1.p1 TRINITY_DN4657_c0_g1~~TRINITY_DN4657_c0_g1_i1.p1  ORF type:complete len:350 (+),score=42.98 TRINITY_DN4657_c0_g1_i1:370-1419(+)
MAQVLLDSGVDTELRTKDWVWGASGEALDAGAVAVYTSGGRTALHLAAEQGNLELCRVLVSAGAEWQVWDNDGLTPQMLTKSCEIQDYLDGLQLPISAPTDQARLVASRARITRRRKVEHERRRREAGSTVRREFDWNSVDKLPVDQILATDAGKVECCDKGLRVFKLPVLRKDYCEALVRAIDDFSAFARTRNINVQRSGSKYGLALTYSGLESMVREIVSRIAAPVAKEHFPEVASSGVEVQHIFLAKYKPGEEVVQHTHADNSDITFNICLACRDLVGARLFFYGNRTDASPKPPDYPTPEAPPLLWYEHQQGVAAIHRGMLYHGGERLESGERYNLIVWLRGLNT